MRYTNNPTGTKHRSGQERRRAHTHVKQNPRLPNQGWNEGLSFSLYLI